MEQTTEWVIFEAMGHVKVAGRYMFENGLHRIDIPDPANPEQYRTERFGSGSVYRITSVDELTARYVAKSCVIPAAIGWNAMDYIKQLAAPQETIEGEHGDPLDALMEGHNPDNDDEETPDEQEVLNRGYF